jgi:hypothetical protein
VDSSWVPEPDRRTLLTVYGHCVALTRQVLAQRASQPRHSLTEDNDPLVRLTEYAIGDFDAQVFDLYGLSVEERASVTSA